MKCKCTLKLSFAGIRVYGKMNCCFLGRNQIKKARKPYRLRADYAIKMAIAYGLFIYPYRTYIVHGFFYLVGAAEPCHSISGRQADLISLG